VEKRLILLGLLRDHEMHGYQLNEMLGNSAGLSIKLTRSNAYKLLNKMEQDGWVTYREEREGNRPARRVYSISEDGEEAFQRLLRENLAAYAVPEFPGAVGINFLDLLPAAEAAELLLQRREKVMVHFEELDAISEEMREMHPGIAYLWRFFQNEIEWLDQIFAKLSQS
jgi:DNA-binding PadR family transcriptional regulator